MDTQAEVTYREIEAILNILIELFVSETDSQHEGAARLLMRVRQLVQSLKPVF